MSKERFTINWDMFEGSSHCEEGVALFATGEIRTFAEWVKWHQPYMPKQAAEVRRIRNARLGIKNIRGRCRRKALQWFQGPIGAWN